MSSSAAQKAKAFELVEAADRRLKSFVVPLFGNKEAKFEDAAELYQRAGNAFKVAKDFAEAGDAFKNAASCYLKVGSQHEAATGFQEAGNAYKKVNSAEAVEMLTKTIELLSDLGRFSQVAKHHKDIGEMFEGEENLELAIEHFQLAADFYQGEDSTSSANQCLLKVAAFSAQLGNYARAIELYEEISTASLDNNLLKWSVKDYFQRALLCQLAGGDEASFAKARAMLERYEGQDPSFSESRECKLVKDVLAHCEAFDVEAFTQVIFEYDQIAKLDTWKTSILLKVKNSLKEGGDSLT
ncbi:soluble NSF attachment protein alpha isoform [Pavlovales sp. CCMP2436]|nr:soluble NSF attachment protein alpha isoform [Pavlovales sp. CCMP2436]